MDKFSYEFLTFAKPFSILLIIPYIIVIIFEKNQILQFIMALASSIFCILQLLKSLVFIDIWIVLVISLILLLYTFLSRENYTLQGNFLIGDMEKTIYESDFQNFLTESEFNFLFSSAKPNRLRENSSNIICEENQEFDKIYYFALIPLHSPINIKKNDLCITYLKESSWYGVVELAREMLEIYNHQSHFHNKTKIDNIINYERSLTSNLGDLEAFERKKSKWIYSLTAKNKNYDVVYYEWDKDVFLNLMKYSSEFIFINKILLLWLRYLSNVNLKLYDHHAVIHLATETNDDNMIMKTDPMIRYENAISNKLQRGKIDYLCEYQDLREPLINLAVYDEN